MIFKVPTFPSSRPRIFLGIVTGDVDGVLIDTENMLKQKLKV
jgi:hypothetical protein